MQINEYVANSHISKSLEDLLDAMVMELYFPDDFAESKISIIEHVIKDVLCLQWDGLIENDKIMTINAVYQMLRDKNNPIRNNLKLIDSRLENLVKPIKSA
jgi:hypothetical protein